jgi:hypothetical protein
MSNTTYQFTRSRSYAWELTVASIALGITLYFEFTYSGLYRWWSEQLMRSIGPSVHKLTPPLTFATLALPPLLAMTFIRRLCRPVASDRGDAELFADHRYAQYADRLAAPTHAAGASTRRTANTPWVYRHILAIVAVTACWIAGGVLWHEYAGMSELSKVSIDNWETGEQPPTRWVELRGKPRANATVFNFDGVDWRGYVPVVSRNWRPGQPVKVFLQVSDSGIENRPWAVGEIHQGLVGRFNPPDAVLAALLQERLVPAGDCALLLVDSTPEATRRAAIVAFSLGFAVLAARLMFSVLRAAPSLSTPNA